MKKLITVSAAALISPDNKILLAQRPEGKALAGKWEFPGGKLEEFETPEQALIRELNEELDIIVSEDNITPTTFVSQEQKTNSLLILLYICNKWSGTPRNVEHTALAWVDIDEIKKYDLPEIDLALVEYLKKAVFNV